MGKVILIDSGLLGLLTHSKRPAQSVAALAWFTLLTNLGVQFVIVEVIDYEIRRELLRLGKAKSLRELDKLKSEELFLPIHSVIWEDAAGLWSEARQHGFATASDDALDIDVLLAVSARYLESFGHEVVVATGNVRHLAYFVDARLWSDITPEILVG